MANPTNWGVPVDYTELTKDYALVQRELEEVRAQLATARSLALEEMAVELQSLGHLTSARMCRVAALMPAGLLAVKREQLEQWQAALEAYKASPMATIQPLWNALAVISEILKR